MTASNTKHPTPASTHRSPALAGRRLHFVGIGGCGMCGLARLARHVGAVCTGSDMAPSEAIDALRQDGFDVSLGQSAQTVPTDCDELVISAAITHGHPEVAEAKQRGIAVTKYAQMLGRLMIGRIGVAIAGTHGKSTTASMLAHTLLVAGLDPSFIIGANCRQIGGGARSSEHNPGLLIAEACEFDRSFHHLHPTHAVILNVEEDHMDVYGSIDAIVEAFNLFAKRIPTHGSLLIQHEMAHRITVAAGLHARVETIGFAPQATWRIAMGDDPANTSGGDPQPGQDQPWVWLYYEGGCVARWPATLPGEHMAYNAAAAAVTAHRLGASWEQIAHAMAGFEGLDRRMQRLGTRQVDTTGANTSDGVTVIDDYGHHPTEIDTTLRALRRYYSPKRLICVFQPHQHSRTRFLLEQFAASFSQADIVIVPHIYFVRDSENERHTVSARDLVDRLRGRGKQAMHVYPFDAIAEQLETITRIGDLVVTMGAGDVWRVAQAYLQHQPTGGPATKQSLKPVAVGTGQASSTT